MRMSRPCYDKPHRCPGWAGGGFRLARVDRCHEGGSIRTRTNDRVYPASVPKAQQGGYPGEHPWRFGYCVKCDVVTWPVGLCHLLDPSWWRWALQRRWTRLR